MNTKLNQRIELFDRNNKALMQKYWAKNMRLQILSGFIYSCSDKEVNIELMDECREMLSREFSLFSSARDNLELPLMASMAVSSSPEQYVKKLKTIYEYVSKGTFLSGDFEMLAAMTLLDVPDGREAEASEKMMDIYKKMGKSHPMLTSSSDKSSAALLSLSDRDPDDLINEMEQCFTALKAGIKNRPDKIQTMSALLTLQNGSVEEKCAKTVELCGKLKANKMNMNSSMALPIVAGLAAVNRPVDEIIEGVKEAFDALGGKTGFGGFGLGREGRTIYGITTYLSCCGEGDAAAKALVRNELISAITQEIILMMIILTSTESSVTSTTN